MYISTDTCLHIEYAGGNSLLGSPNPDIVRVVSLMQGQELIFNSDEVLQHHSQLLPLPTLGYYFLSAEQ